MLKTFIEILLIFLLLGCIKEPNIPAKEPNKIDGLELTFIHTNLNENFITIYFINETIGYIAGYNGAMYKTNDGGSNWNQLQTNTLLPFYDITFLNDKEGFAVGGESSCGGMNCVPKGAIIIHTTDGGQTWENISVTLSQKIELRSICFVNNSLGFAVGNGLILSTNDRGITWQETKINNLGGIMMDVKFVNDKQGLITGTRGILIKTTDGGENWNVMSPFPTGGANTLALVDQNLIFLSGYTKIQKSLDFGNTWSDLPNSPNDVFKIIFKSDLIGYAFGRDKYSGGDIGYSYGAIYYTTDGGITWKGNDRIRELSVIVSANFPNVNIGFAVSRNVVVKIKRQ